jgi:hypothetical protein
MLQENMAAGLGKLSEGLAVLATAQAKLTEMDSERRLADAERRATEAERHASLLNVLSRRNWYVFMHSSPHSIPIDIIL